MKFKVGDRVRLIKDYESCIRYNDMKLNKIYTIEESEYDRGHQSHRYQYQVNGWWFPKEGYLGPVKLRGGKRLFVG